MKTIIQICLLLLLVFFFTTRANGWSDIIPEQGRPAGMGNAYVSQTDLNAALHNQAGLSQLGSLSVLLYIENRFLLKGLTSQGIILGIPTSKGVFSTALQCFGQASWLETNISVSYSKQLNQKLSGGIQLHYNGMKLPEENKYIGTAGAELGFIYMFLPNLFAGIHLANPHSILLQNIADTYSKPWCLSLGGHAFITDNICIAIEAEKAEYQNLIFKAGIEWEIVSKFFIRLGYHSGFSKLYSGVGFSYRFITADLTFSHHQTLGVTPSASITFKLK